MYTSGMIGGSYSSANMQRVIGQNPVSSDMSRYEKRSREPQIVRIKTTDNQTTIALPFLDQYYANIGDQMDRSDQVFFQIRNFRYKPNFDNIMPGMMVDVLSTTHYMYMSSGLSFSQDGITNTAAANGRIPQLVLNKTDVALCVTIGELVDIMNAELEKILIQIYEDYTTAPNADDWIDDIENRNLKNFYNIFSMTKFNFDTYTGYIVLETKSEYNPQLTTHIKPVGGVLAANFMYRYIVQLQSSDMNSQINQVRVSKLLGLSDTIQYKAGSVLINAQNIDQDETYYQTEFDSATNDPYTFIRYMKQISPDTFTGFPSYVTKHWQSDDDGFQFYIKAKTAARLVPMDEIQIRSSLQTNYWEQDGRRTNILCTVPIIGNVAQHAQDYQPPGTQQRVYNAKDSIASLRNFKLMITDELSQEVKFNEPYELTLAIFFCN